jgi:hypothetical protein
MTFAFYHAAQPALSALGLPKLSLIVFQVCDYIAGKGFIPAL